MTIKAAMNVSVAPLLRETSKFAFGLMFMCGGLAGTGMWHSDFRWAPVSDNIKFTCALLLGAAIFFASVAALAMLYAVARAVWKWLYWRIWLETYLYQRYLHEERVRQARREWERAGERAYE